jgi:hypothetical protein
MEWYYLEVKKELHDNLMQQKLSVLTLIHWAEGNQEEMMREERIYGPSFHKLPDFHDVFYPNNVSLVFTPCTIFV